MKNWEKYEKEIRESCGQIAVTKSGEVKPCVIPCDTCKLWYELGGCEKARMNWLYSEYEEPKLKLTKEEKAIVDAFIYTDYKIGRDKDGRLWLCAEICQLLLKEELFPFIESGTVEWTLQELKELEVEN